MCQLGAIVNIQKTDSKTQELIAQTMRVMLTLMSSGNKDGAGIAFSYKDEEMIYSYKSGQSGSAIAKELEIDTSRPFRHVIMHTRFATQGVVNELNAHPHITPYGMLMHNGWTPTMYAKIATGTHPKQSELEKLAQDMGKNTVLTTQCDTEALALSFHPDPEIMDTRLVGDEVFALLHLDYTGKEVTLMTQYNTVHMAYSHILGAVIVATKASVVEHALDFLGEVFPITQVDYDMVYWFNGEKVDGHEFPWGTNLPENIVMDDEDDMEEMDITTKNGVVTVKTKKKVAKKNLNQDYLDIGGFTKPFGKHDNNMTPSWIDFELDDVEPMDIRTDSVYSYNEKGDREVYGDDRFEEFAQVNAFCLTQQSSNTKKK